VGNSDFSVFSLSPQFSVLMRYVDSLGTNDVFVGMSDFVSGYIPTTQEHIGFWLDCNAGTMTSYATNANGTTQTTSSFTGITEGYNGLYTAIMDGSTNCKFYYGTTLKATHTTNLPSGNPDYQCHFMNNNAAGTTNDNAIQLMGADVKLKLA
jgi:hypothetical protein